MVINALTLTCSGIRSHRRSVSRSYTGSSYGEGTYEFGYVGYEDRQYKGRKFQRAPPWLKGKEIGNGINSITISYSYMCDSN